MRDPAAAISGVELDDVFREMVASRHPHPAWRREESFHGATITVQFVVPVHRERSPVMTPLLQPMIHDMLVHNL
jgi:hypothetical protein